MPGPNPYDVAPGEQETQEELEARILAELEAQHAEAAAGLAPGRAPARSDAELLSAAFGPDAPRNVDPWQGLGKPPLSQLPKDSDDAIFESLANSEGNLRDYLGYDEERAIPQRNEAGLAELRQLLSQRPAQDPPQTLQPGPHEQRYRAENPQLTSDRINQMVIGARFFGGNPDQTMQNALRMQQGWRQGLEQARRLDAQVRPGRLVDQATAEALVTEYGISPEAAAQVRVGSPILNMLRQKNARLEAERLARQTEHVKMQGATQLNVARGNNITSAGNAETGAEAQVRAAQERAKRRKGAGGGGKGGGKADLDDVITTALFYNGDKRGVEITRDQAAAYVAYRSGKAAQPPSDLTPAQAEFLAANYAPYAAQAKIDPKALLRGVSSIATQEGKTGDQEESDDRKRAHATFLAGLRGSKDRLKFRTEAQQSRNTLVAASGGLKLMQGNPKLMSLFFEYQADPNQGGSFTGENFKKWVASKITDPKEREIMAKAGGAIWGVINELTKARSGAAVTNGEWARLVREVGLPVGFDPGNRETGPATLRAWLDRALQNSAIFAENYNAEFGPQDPQGPLPWGATKER